MPWLLYQEPLWPLVWPWCVASAAPTCDIACAACCMASRGEQGDCWVTDCVCVRVMCVSLLRACASLV